MASRFNLHEILVSILGSRNVYYQPPESAKLSYPCIIYEKEGNHSLRADDKKYVGRKRYSVKVISKDPDNDLADKIEEAFDYCSFDRRYINDNLYHDSLDLFY